MRTLALAIALAACADARAANCTPKEYAQLKDEASTPRGKITLRYGYCLAENGRKHATTKREADACEELQAKILQALESANDSKGAIWALGGCKGDAPDAGKYPGQK